MTPIAFRWSIFSLLVAAVCAAETGTSADSNWGQWRGPQVNGVSPDAKPPVTWGEGKNIRWKVEIPGSGLSTPIIWGERIYLHTAVPDVDKSAAPQPSPAEQPADPKAGGPGEGQGRGRRGGGMQSETPTEKYRFMVVALERRTGKPVWEKTVRMEVPHEGHHEDGSYAPASPLTDGKRIYAHFGSRGIYCLDMDWQRRLGKGPGRHEDAQRLRRGQFARARRRQTHRELGSRRRIVHRRSGRGDG
jgi:hypothetical protein